jgi:hypothetical protein
MGGITIGGMVTGAGGFSSVVHAVSNNPAASRKKRIWRCIGFWLK